MLASLVQHPGEKVVLQLRCQSAGQGEADRRGNRRKCRGGNALRRNWAHLHSRKAPADSEPDWNKLQIGLTIAERDFAG
jgi:hypothetical protein